MSPELEVLMSRRRLPKRSPVDVPGVFPASHGGWRVRIHGINYGTYDRMADAKAVARAVRQEVPTP
jgi:hypothetical protein